MIIKKILLIIAIAFCFVGCSKKVETKEEYIPFYLDEDSNTTFYIASPSGIVYAKASNSELYKWHNSKGETISIYEVQNVKD